MRDYVLVVGPEPLRMSLVMCGISINKKITSVSATRRNSSDGFITRVQQVGAFYGKNHPFSYLKMSLFFFHGSKLVRYDAVNYVMPPNHR